MPQKLPFESRTNPACGFAPLEPPGFRPFGPSEGLRRGYNLAVISHIKHRVLGLDVGSRRIGIAVSDPLGITAQGLETLQRTNKRRDFGHLLRLVHEYDVKEVVVGLPLRMSGAEGTQSEKMRSFAEELNHKLKIPVHLWDERLTSAEANRFLRETELSIEKRGKAVDRMAAVLILQSWMESRASSTRSEPSEPSDLPS